MSRCPGYALIGLLLLLGACSSYNAKQQQTLLSYKYQKKINSFYKRELYSELRDYALKTLQTISDTDIVNQCCLYNAIGCSYRYSYHYDSAVCYCQKAYNLSAQSKNIPLQANMGADLLITYRESNIYSKQQDSIFDILNGMQDKVMPSNVNALLLDAMANYCNYKGMRGMAHFFLFKSQAIYDKLIADKSLQYMDSLNLGSHYFYMTESGAVLKNKSKRIVYLNNGRRWIGANKLRLVGYYTGMINWYCYRLRSTDTAKMYIDSLVGLENATGLNFNDELIFSNLEVCDYYFFEEKNYMLAQKYCDEAKRYFEQAIDPGAIVSCKWMQADIDLMEGRYRKSLSGLKAILPEVKCFSYAEQMRIAESIATCFVKLKILDSAVVYYKQIAPLTIEGYSEQQRNIQQEAEAKHFNKIKQDKIDQQNKSIEYARNQRLWLVLGLSLTLLSIALLFIIYRNKRKTARKLDAQNIQLSSLNLQLKEANETKSKLFGIISHDLRSPISQLMQLQLPESLIVLSSEEKEMLEQETHDATVNLLDSMEDLLIWSKTQLQSFNVNKTWTDLNEVYQKCRKLLHLQIRNKKLKVINNIGANTLLETDANFLLTIFRNLLNNAINASPAQGTIIIDFEPFATNETQHHIIITNEGESFSQQEYINALNNTQTSHFLKGGLGLQVVDELSRKINMNISFEALPIEGAQCTIKLNCKIRIADNDKER